MVEFKDLCLDENVVVNCKTKEQSDNYLKWLKSKGFNFPKLDIWSEWYADATCYKVSPGNADIWLSSIGFYKENKTKIISYEEALFTQTNTVEESTPKGQQFLNTFIYRDGNKEIVMRTSDLCLDDLGETILAFLKAQGYNYLNEITFTTDEGHTFRSTI